MASRLRLPPGEPALLRTFTVSEAGKRVQRVDSYRRLPLPVDGDPEPARDHDEPMACRGLIVDEVSVRMPTPEETRSGMSRASPVARVLRTLHDHADRPVEVCDIKLAGDHHVLVYPCSVRRATSWSVS